MVITNTTKAVSQRLLAIDALRAVVMVLMIFVNDLWSLVNIPRWLEHAPGDANYMGLADVVFPAFLFIVGLSVPFAIESRQKKGDGPLKIAMHVASRSVALLIMGFFHVNLESYSESAILSKPVWQLFITFGFFFVWMEYSPPDFKWRSILKPLGILLLICMALLYQNDQASGILAMRPAWWGILGLIGWAYLIVSGVFLLSKGRFLLVIVAFIVLLFLNVATLMAWLDVPLAAPAALAMGGAITCLMYKKFNSKLAYFWVGIMVFALVLFCFGYYTTSIWGISKIRATPSWVAICAGITLIGFGLMVFITEQRKQRKWYELIKPAGTSALTCYLLPYIHYALIGLLSLPQLPLVLRTGSIGLLKSFLYALIIVIITGWLGKRNIRLKV